MILGTARSLKRKSEPTIALKNGRPSPETVFGNAKFAIFIWCPADPTSLPQACREGGQSVAVGRGRSRGGREFNFGGGDATHIPQSQRETNRTLHCCGFLIRSFSGGAAAAECRLHFGGGGEGGRRLSKFGRPWGTHATEALRDGPPELPRPSSRLTGP